MNFLLLSVLQGILVVSFVSLIIPVGALQWWISIVLLSIMLSLILSLVERINKS